MSQWWWWSDRCPFHWSFTINKIGIGHWFQFNVHCGAGTVSYLVWTAAIFSESCIWRFPMRAFSLRFLWKKAQSCIGANRGSGWMRPLSPPPHEQSRCYPPDEMSPPPTDMSALNTGLGRWDNRELEQVALPSLSSLSNFKVIDWSHLGYVALQELELCYRYTPPAFSECG